MSNSTKYEDLKEIHDNMFNGFTVIIDSVNQNNKVLKEHNLLDDYQISIYNARLRDDFKVILGKLKNILDKHYDKKGEVEDFSEAINIYLDYNSLNTEAKIIIANSIASITDRTLELAPELGAIYFNKEQN